MVFDPAENKNSYIQVKFTPKQVVEIRDILAAFRDYVAAKREDRTRLDDNPKSSQNIELARLERIATNYVGFFDMARDLLKR